MVYRPFSKKETHILDMVKKKESFFQLEKKNIKNKKMVFTSGIKHSKTQHLKNEKNKKIEKT